MRTMMINRFLIATGLAALPFLLAARETHGVPSGMGQQGRAKAAGCAPATHSNELDLNNVRARIETGGNVWQNRSLGRAAYEVPKTTDESGARALFAGGLWIGGMDPAENLKLAAVMFRQAGQNDYWPGPLDTVGQAAVTPATCLKYDRSWKVTRPQAEQHIRYYTCLADPECDVNTEFPEGYVIPTAFLEWPARGDVAGGQALELAPFQHGPGIEPDGDYRAERGDYPGYDLYAMNDCKNRTRENPVPLYGDQTIWWVFNDKGSIHTESSGQPIGMEIRAQAFAFSTNDDINNMTFYNYVLFNRGTLDLDSTYFGQYVDPDLGNAQDDYVGCDVERGLGYAYNGDNNDETAGGSIGYGVQPPAVGVDFFEGPFQDADFRDNPLTDNCNEAVQEGGIVYAGIGMGYGDTLADNERFGMRAFLYYNNTGGASPSATTDPSSSAPQQFYNYLNGVWKDNTPMTYGGSGYAPGQSGMVRTAYMFPGDSDPLGWATSCQPQSNSWTEQTAGNAPYDRRFIQSSGPFTLKSGSYNNITVGVVWARAVSGGPMASVKRVLEADDKAQALFDNCFRVLDGPDAPLLEVQELDREILLYLTYPESGTNNRNDSYVELDPTIPPFSYISTVVDSTFITLGGDTVTVPIEVTSDDATPNDRHYHFQGYQVFQVLNAEVGPDQLGDVNVARLVAQVDKKDNIARLVNWPMNVELGLPTPVEQVNGANSGVVHSFRFTEDKFAQGGDPRLVNFKTYYYIAVAYGYNEWQAYNSNTRTGQPFPYLRGRRAADGGSIRAYSAIPHKPAPEAGGTVANVQFGDKFRITRLEGQGNGGFALELESETENAIMSGPPYRAQELLYKKGLGPIEVSVVDPLKVPSARFELWFNDSTAIPNPIATNQANGYPTLNDAEWMLVRLSGSPTAKDTVRSKHALAMGVDKLVLDWGLAVNIRQAPYDPEIVPATLPNMQGPTVITSVMDPLESWYVGIPDVDGENMQNWIRSGRIKNETGSSLLRFVDKQGWDTLEQYENILGRTWAPWLLVGDTALQPLARGGAVVPIGVHSPGTTVYARLSDLPSIQVVFTPDKSKWTRCVVMEAHSDPTRTHPTGTRKLAHKPVPSVDKNGIPTGSPGCNEAEATLTDAEGMSWFPGYVIDLETGERLNMAFSEDSFLGGSIGRDMIWNPSSVLEVGNSPVFGGCHWIYVFANFKRKLPASPTQMGPYDEGAFFRANMDVGGGVARSQVWRSVAWVGSGLVRQGVQLRSAQDGIVPSEVRLRINISKPYDIYAPPYAGYEPAMSTDRNRGLPLYTFYTGDAATQTNVASVAEEALDMISVVPNPYYAYSGYETNRLDYRVKFINLPQQCVISIYNVGGTLVRRYRKDNELTYLDWDLKNSYNVPISGGTYICHVEVPGLGERVLKWFGVMRPLDLQNF